MKLRIKGPTLRLRLTQGEVRELGEGGPVEEQVPFGGGVNLTYRLRLDPSASRMNATFAAGVLEVRIPDGLARAWCESQEVTLAGAQEVPPDTLRITVEKDFACLAPREMEDESDNFPHPRTAPKAG